MYNINSKKTQFKKGNRPKNAIRQGEKIALGHRQTTEHKQKLSDAKIRTKEVAQ
jgi:hypothetical protein